VAGDTRSDYAAPNEEDAIYFDVRFVVRSEDGKLATFCSTSTTRKPFGCISNTRCCGTSAWRSRAEMSIERV
jgi:hypothetical protein